MSLLSSIYVYPDLTESRVEDRSVRYVAEENIDLILPRFTELPQSLTAIAGKHFKRWDEVTRAFVSNVKDEYPDD